jgi:hypothetical protein
MNMIEIATPMGILRAKPAHSIKQKHWNRIEELCITAHDGELLRADLQESLFFNFGLTSYIDRQAFDYIETEDREIVVSEWLESSKSLKEFHDLIESLGGKDDREGEKKWTRVRDAMKWLKTVGR